MDWIRQEQGTSFLLCVYVCLSHCFFFPLGLQEKETHDKKAWSKSLFIVPFTVSIVRLELRNEKNLFLFTPKKQNQERGTVPSYGF